MPRATVLSTVIATSILVTGGAAQLFADEQSNAAAPPANADGSAAGLFGLFGAGGATPNAEPAQNGAVWSDTQILAAVAQKDGSVLQAIQDRANASKDDAGFVPLMIQVLELSAGSDMKPSLPGEPGYPRQFGPSGLQRPGGASRPVPPGGASLQPQRNPQQRNSAVAVTTLEAMLGRAVLSYFPDKRSREDKEGGGGFGNIDLSKIKKKGANRDDDDRGKGRNRTRPDEDRQADAPAENLLLPLTIKDTVRATIRGLITNNTAAAWTLVGQVFDGRVTLPLTQRQLAPIVISEISLTHKSLNQSAEDLLMRAVNLALAPPVANDSLQLLAAMNRAAASHYMQLERGVRPEPGSRTYVNSPMDRQMLTAGIQAQSPSDPLQLAAAQLSGSGNSPDPGAVNRILKRPRQGRERLNRKREKELRDERNNQARHRLRALNANDGTTTAGRRLPAGSETTDAETPIDGTVSEASMSLVSAAAMQAVATALWHPETADSVATLLETSRASDAELFGLAACMPLGKVRHALHEAFSRFYSSGCIGLRQRGLFSSAAGDPGFLNVLKALPRSPAQKTADAETADPRTSWSDATLEAVLFLRSRLRAVENKPELLNEARLPLRLHKNHPEPDVSIVLESPTEFAAELGGSAPSSSKLYYCRLQVAPAGGEAMQAIVDHYEKRAKAAKNELRDKGILWYDGVRENDDGSRQAMDVIVQATDSGDYTIEVIVLVSTDPKRSVDEAEVAAK